MSILWVINGILLVIVLAMVFNELYLNYGETFSKNADGRRI